MGWCDVAEWIHLALDTEQCSYETKGSVMILDQASSRHRILTDPAPWN